MSQPQPTYSFGTGFGIGIPQTPVFLYAEEIPFDLDSDIDAMEKEYIPIDDEEDLEQVRKETEASAQNIKVLEDQIKVEMRKKMFKTVLKGEIYTYPSREKK